MSEWEIISEQRAPQTMPPPMSPPAVDNEWEVVSERKAPNAMPPPTASGGWEIIREEPASQSAWAPSLDTVTIPEYGDVKDLQSWEGPPPETPESPGFIEGATKLAAGAIAGAASIPAMVGAGLGYIPDVIVGGPTYAGKKFEERIGSPARAILGDPQTNPESYKMMEAAWAPVTEPIKMSGEGWRLIGAELEKMGMPTPDIETYGEDTEGRRPYIEPLLASIGEAAALFGMGIVIRKIKSSDAYRYLSVGERNLIEKVASGVEADINNGNLTVDQIRAMWKNPVNREALLKKYAGVEKRVEPETTPEPGPSTTQRSNLESFLDRSEIDPENLRYIVENPDLFSKAEIRAAQARIDALKTTPKHTDDLEAIRQDLKAGEATPQEVIDAYASKLDDIAGLMQEKEATALEARRGRYETPGQTALDFGTAGTPLFDETTQPSPATEKTQPAATSDAEGARTFYHGTAAADFDEFNTPYVYLSPDVPNAQMFAENPILNKGATGQQRVLSVEAKPGKVKNIDEAVLEALMEGDVDETIKAEAEKAKSEGYRYLQFEHPDAFGEKDFTATISLYPKEDLKVNEPATLKEPEALKQRYFDQQTAEIKPAAEYGEAQKLVLSGGPPAVGKTGMIEKAGIDKSRAVVVNADDVKALAGKETDNAFHEESSRIANDLLEYAIDSGRNTIYDSQLTNFAKADAQIKKVLGSGGYADIFFINASAETAKASNLARHAKGQSKRLPPDEAIVKGYNYGLPTFIELYKRYKDNPKVHFALWDNDVDFRPVEDRAVFVKDAKGLQVLNNDLFDQLMNTAYNSVEGGKKYVRKERITERDLQAQIHQIRGRSERLGREKLKRPALGGAIEEQRDTAPSGLPAPQATVSGAAPSPNLPEGKVNEPEKEHRENARIAAQAVSELGKPTLLQRIKALSGFGMRDRGRTDGGEPVRVPGQEARGAEGSPRRIVTLGKTISDLKELKSVRLRGTEAATWNAVYSALRIVRNANVEVMHVLYRGKTSGTILYNEAYSCRLPGAVENVSPSLLSLNAVGEANKLSRLHGEEVEIILAHNHPSGDVNVSNADRNFTKEAAAAVAMAKGNFAGQIVIDHNKYSLIDGQGNANMFDLPDVPEEYRNDPLLTMPVPHRALGKSVTMPDHIALVARDIQRGEHYFTVLLRAGTKIRGIVNVPLDILNDKKAATEFIHELAVQHGAQDVFAYREDFTNEQKGTLINMVKENTFRDVVYDAGNVAGYFPTDRRKIFGKDRTTIEAQRLEGVPQEVKGKGAVRQVDAWHGSPHTFNKFKSEKIGIGEGNQSFGWGLYFTDLEDVARHYADKLGYGADIAINGKPIRKGENAFLAALSTDLAQATTLTSNTKAKQIAQIYIDSAIDRLENNLPYTGTKAEQAEALKYLKSMGRVENIEKKHSRNLYKVTLHKGKQPGEYTWLDWDKSVPNSIWDKMADQAEKEGDKEYGDWLRSRKDLQYKLKGEGIYLSLASHFGFGGRDIDGMREASLFLLRAGIDGIRYPAGTLTGIKSDAFNYVVFDENAVTVEEHAVYEKEGEYGDIKAEIEAEIADILDIANTIQNESSINAATAAGEIPKQLRPMADFIRENNLTKEQFHDIRYNDKNPLHETMNKLMDRASLGINKVWDDFGFNHQGEFYDRVVQTIPKPSRPPEVGGQAVKEQSLDKAAKEADNVLQEGKTNEPTRRYSNQELKQRIQERLNVPVKFRSLSGEAENLPAGKRSNVPAEQLRIRAGEHATLKDTAPANVPGGKVYGSQVGAFERTGRIDYSGQKVKGIRDIISLLQIARNPHVENLHFFFVGINTGTIHRNNLYSSQMPGFVAFIPEGQQAKAAWELSFRARRLAKQVGEPIDIVMAHNHPSGDPTPSPEDKKVTNSLRKRMKNLGIRMDYHVVTNHGTAAVIYGSDWDHETITIPDIANTVDPFKTEPVKNEKLGHLVMKPQHIAGVAAGFQRGDKFITVVYRSDGIVRGIENIPVGYLGAAADSKAGKPSPAADFFRGRARQFGANDIFIYKDTVSQEEFDYLTQLYDDGVIRDAVWAEGKESLYKHGYDYEQEKRYGKDFGKYRGGAVKQEGKYGEDDDTSFDFGANIEKAIEENPEKHISLDFKDHLEGYIGHLFNMVVAGEPGKRLALEGMGGQDQVVSWGSTYPEFMKGQGWSAKEVLAALRHAQAGEKTTDKQKEIIRAALHQATDMFFEDMDRWAPNLSEEALEKMEASIEPAIDDFLSKYYREKREREIERQKIARTTKITKSQYDWEREKQKAKEGAWMKGFKSRQEEVNALQSELAKTEAKLQTQIAHVRKLFEGEKIKEGAWKEAERIKNTEIKTLQGEIKRLKDRLAKAKEEAAPKPKVKRMSRKGQIRIVTGQVLANDEINLREMDALKSQIRMEAAAAREAYRAGNKAGLAKARARYQSMKDILRIKRAQQADIRKMIKQMKDVAKKADQLPPEYKLAITDLLEPWDMARLTDKNRVKLQAIRNEMETNKDADFPPSMLETLKRLDKRPIRDLSYDEIQSIHRAVMHFATLGRNKIKGMAAQQRIVREMTRGVVKGEMKEAEAGSDNYDIRYSDEKKIKGFLQKAKNQFGIHLVGWEALVESVSGPRSMFYKVIYRMVKEGSLLRDKIMYEIEDLFLKAQDAFQQKHGIKDIADWLDADRTIEYVSGKTITMSRNQLISLELGWRDADWRRSVEEGGFGLWNNPMPNDPNRVYQLGPEGIEKIIAAVTPTEREYADMAVPIIQKTGDMLADKFLEINGYEMPRTESGAYWRKDVMASERGKTDEQTELEKARLGRPGIFKGMTIQRTGDSSAVWLKPFTVAMREMSKRGADYVALEEPMSLAAWLMYDKEFRKEFDKRYGMPLWKEIEQGLKDLSDTYQPVRDTTWERVGTWLRNKSTLFALGLNYATTLKQFTGAINYLVYVDPVHLANAIVKYGTNRNDVRRLHKQMSTEYRHRREEGYSQDVGNVITSLSATGQKPSLVTRIGVAGMRPLQAIDIFGVDIGMLAAVDQALDAFKAGKLTEDMKDALDMSDEDIKGMTYAEQFEAAYKWADYCTERTQSMSRPEHMSGWQRGSEFSKQFSMFMGEVQKNLTGLYRAYNKVQRGDIGAHMHLTKNILLYLVVSSLIIDAGVNAMRDILRGRRPDRWWAVGLKAITSPIPIIRDITQTAVDTAQGKGFGLSGGDTPIARFQESIAKVVVKGTKATTGKTAKERKEAATATAGAILNTAALAAGLPWPAVQEPFRIAKREETARKERQRNR